MEARVVRKGDHSWYVTLVGREGAAPEYAVAVVVENGGSGSRTAAPMAKKVMDFYLIERLRRAAIKRGGRNFG